MSRLLLVKRFSEEEFGKVSCTPQALFHITDGGIVDSLQMLFIFRQLVVYELSKCRCGHKILWVATRDRVRCSPQPNSKAHAGNTGVWTTTGRINTKCNFVAQMSQWSQAPCTGRSDLPSSRMTLLSLCLLNRIFLSRGISHGREQSVLQNGPGLHTKVGGGSFLSLRSWGFKAAIKSVARVKGLQ